MSACSRTTMTTAATIAAALAIGNPAWAQDTEPIRDLDIELLRPTFSYRSIPGLDTPDIGEEGQLRMGIIAQYERDPLVLYEFENELGGVVGNRATMQLGVSWDFFERAGARLILPLNANFGSNVPDLDADTAGLGDIGAGIRFLAVKTGGFQLGARADMIFPTNFQRNAWLGESDMRPVVGLLVRQDIGRFSALLDTNATIRTAVDTEQDFELGSELAITPGLMYEISPDFLNVYVDSFIRGGFNNLFQGGAENPIETVLGAQLFPKENLLVDVGAGRGWNEGYGTTDFRIFGGLTYTFVKKEEPPPPEPEPVVELYEIPPENVEELVAEVKVWEEGELARVEQDQIVIREPIQFYLDTTQILPESLPTLDYVARLLNGKGEIVHLQIEGHASEEGSFEYNYDLSTRRARAVWEQLIRSGVHPDRLSYKGMGEVVPIQMGEDEQSLSANRRVEFDIIKQIGPLELVPEYSSSILLPWSGERHTVNQAPLGADTPTAPEGSGKPLPSGDVFRDALDAEDEVEDQGGALPEPESKGDLESGTPGALPEPESKGDLESETPGALPEPEPPAEEPDAEGEEAPTGAALPPAAPPTEDQGEGDDLPEAEDDDTDGGEQ